MALQSGMDGFWIVDVRGRFLAVNDSLCELLGYTRDEVLAMSITEIEDSASAKDTATHLQATLCSGTEQFLTRYIRKDGATIEVEVSVHHLPLHGDCFFGFTRDMGGRRHAEQSLRDADARFRGLVEQSMVGIYQVDGDKILYQNRRADELFGYEPGSLVGVAMKSLVVAEDWPRAEREIRLLMSGEKKVVKLDFRALRKDGREAIISAQGVLAAFDGRPTMIGVLQDVTERRRDDEQIRRYLAQLEDALTQTVEMAITVSTMRDPYTAAHAHRVAEIAVAMGVELGLDGKRLEGLRVASCVHDIGKIAIPAEILAKPSRLTPAEYALIKGHPQASYDILKTVNFPWPVAQVALQHHERFDGSGYPHGLKGEEIVFEARILAVADVVEAMAAHRPYRPGRGLDAALTEIERGRGTAYDPVAADACLRLFREKGFRLPPVTATPHDMTEFSIAI
jgi:PAS domain S-box-containing protein